MQSLVLGWSRSAKRLVVVGLDIVLAMLATWLAFSLRLETLHWPVDAQWWVYGLTPLLFVPVFIRFGLYRAIKPGDRVWFALSCIALAIVGWR